ncbi:hypothetical protein AB0C07_09190 [Actinoplanes missouriensis]
MNSNRLNDRPGLVSRDGIHFAGMGQAIIAGVLVEALGKRLVDR